MLSHILQVYKVQQGVVLNGFRFLKKPCLMRLMKTVLQGLFGENLQMSAYNQPYISSVFRPNSQLQFKIPSIQSCVFARSPHQESSYLEAFLYHNFGTNQKILAIVVLQPPALLHQAKSVNSAKRNLLLVGHGRAPSYSVNSSHFLSFLHFARSW